MVGEVMPAVLGGAFGGDEVWYRALEADTHVHGAKGCLEGCENDRWGRVGVGGGPVVQCLSWLVLGVSSVSGSPLRSVVLVVTGATDSSVSNSSFRSVGSVVTGATGFSDPDSSFRSVGSLATKATGLGPQSAVIPQGGG